MGVAAVSAWAPSPFGVLAVGALSEKLGFRTAEPLSWLWR